MQKVFGDMDGTNNNMPTDIPFSALNALLNLSFDAVLQAD